MSIDQRGPVAPKDPTVKRPGFYIMRGKNISAAPREDGTGVCFIYEDNGRLESSARLVGNVEEERILQLMGTVQGLRRLVHSIGVSVKSKDSREPVRFAFQMYGKSDPYVSGTTLVMDVPSDGMEYVYELDGADWSEDDNVPGQIRFEFARSGIFAEVSVILYLRDGFEAPLQPEENPVDLSSENYQKMIEKSLIQAGNNARLKRAMKKARNGEDVTMAFIGGSITQGAGAVPINTACYAYLTFEGFCRQMGRGTDENIHYVKAGVGGTPSELGMLRYERDVLSDGEIVPDIVVIEFAVNDEGDETKGECYDSLVRKVYNGPGAPAVILLFAVFADDWNLEERLGIVGQTYHLPMVSTRQSVVEQFYQTKEQGNVISKNQFFYDLFHPANAGHRIMADGILYMLSCADAAGEDEEYSISDVKPPIGGDFEQVYLVDRKSAGNDLAICPGDFTDIDTDIQYVERNLDLKGSPEFGENWMYRGTAGREAKSFQLDVTCRALLVIFKDSASVQVGEAEVYVDGVQRLTLNPHEVGWTHCNPVIVFRGEVSGPHHVEVKMKEGSEDRDFTILGFGIVK